MTLDLLQTLTTHARQRDFVSIERDEFGARRMHGYVLAVSPGLVMVQPVEDFHLDGLRVLRLADISDVEQTEADRFHQTLMVHEGLEQQVRFGEAFDLRDWPSILRQLAREHDLMILECEAPEDDDFVIGRVGDLGDDAVGFEWFSNTGEWSAVPTEISFERLTCCQVDAPYINVYRRHFERLAKG